MCVECLFSRSPGQPLTGLDQRAPKGRPPPPLVPTQNPSLPRRPIQRLYCPGLAQARIVSRHCFQVLPGPATWSHTVNRGTPVAQLGQRPQLNVPEKRSHPRHGDDTTVYVTILTTEARRHTRKKRGCGATPDDHRDQRFESPD
jgi:hypothetical protein